MKKEQKKEKTPIVLQLLPAMNQGGVEHVTLMMARAIGKWFGKNASFIASQGGNLGDSLHQKDEPFCHITLPLASKNPFTMVWNAWCLLKVIKHHHINLLHARSRAPAWSALLAAKWAKIPLITTVHGAHKVHYHSKILSFFKRLYNSSMVRGDIVIAVSPFIKGYIEKNYPNVNPLVIQEGIDTTFYQRTQHREDNRSPVLFLPSRLSSTKGIDCALLALAKLIQDDPSITLMLIHTGKKSYREKLDQMIDEHHLKKNVIFVAPQPDLRAYYDAADIVLMPSLVPEALGRTSIEALSMECILIASDIGATSSICVHENTGFLVRPGDVQGLVSTIKRVISMEQPMKEQLHKNGRAWVKAHFDHNGMIKQTLDVYTDF